VERLPAVPPNIRRIRASVGALMDEHGWGDEEARSRVILALSEVVSNAVRHAYAGREPGDVEVAVTLDTTELRIAVRDFGRVQLPSPSPGMGIGLSIAERCADELRIRPLPGGTTVELLFQSEG
jgi:anti-sigma regulatory factor (Ser/Thr protein kinase)